MADDLLQRCRDRGFTPGVSHLDALLQLWRDAGSDRKHKKLIVTALTRADAGVAAELLRMASEGTDAERAMRLRVVGRIHQRTPLSDFEASLPALLRDAAAPVVREAARIVSKLDEERGRTFEEELLAACSDAEAPELKALVDALGRVGGARAAAILPDLDPGDDEDLSRRIQEAAALLERRIGRATPGRILDDRPLPEPVTVVLRYRADVGEVVEQQLGEKLNARAETESTLRFSGTLAQLQRARSVLDFGLSFPLPAGPDLVDRIVEGLSAPELLAAVTAWTEGPVRFRLATAVGRPPRSVVWGVARALTGRDTPLLNDSRDARWTVEIDEDWGELRCIPRHDPRFAYRVADVPAASHPTLAATLAWLGAPQAGERVWDPFCGSAGELIECARLAPDLELWGADTSAGALEAARANLESANLDPARIHLMQADARDVDVPPPDLIVTNPPMGRRVARDGTVKPLLAGFVERISKVLPPHGRLIWVTPLPVMTAEAAADVGLRSEDLGTFDMGGFEVGLQKIYRQ